jgi:hypothetical protein
MSNFEQHRFWDDTYELALNEKGIVVGEGSEAHSERVPDRGVYGAADGQRQLLIELKTHGLDKDLEPEAERTPIRFDKGEMDQIKEEMEIAAEVTQQKTLVLLVREGLDAGQREELQQHAKDVGCELFISDLEEVEKNVAMIESILERGAAEVAHELRERILAEDTKEKVGEPKANSELGVEIMSEPSGEPDEPTVTEVKIEPSADISPTHGVLPPD